MFNTKLKEVLRLVRANKWLLVTFLAIVLIHVITLPSYPSPFMDESQWANRALGYLQTGENIGDIDKQALNIIGVSSRIFPIVPTILYSFGVDENIAIELVNLRIISLFFGFVLLISVFYIGLRSSNLVVAVMSLISLSSTREFFHAGHYVRPDIMSASMCYLAASIVLAKERKGMLPYIFSGLLIGLSLELHVRASIIIGATVITLFLSLGSNFKFCSKNKLILFGFGVLTGAFVYFILHVDLTSASDNLGREAFYQKRLPPLFTFNISEVVLSIYELSKSLLVLHFANFIVACSSVFLLFSKIKKEEKQLIIFSILVFFLGAGLMQSKTQFKVIFVTPAISLMSSLVLFHVIKFSWKNRLVKFIFPRLAIATFSLNIFLNYFAVFRQTKECSTEFNKVISRLENTITPDARVIGSELYWLGLQDRSFISWTSIPPLRNFYENKSIPEILNSFNADFFILDEALKIYLVDYEPKNSFNKAISMPKKPFENFLSDSALRVSEIETQCYGSIDVFKLK